MASDGLDGTVKLWETASCTLMCTLRSDRRFERMDISRLTGVTQEQRSVLLALGAVEAQDAPQRYVSAGRAVDLGPRSRG